MKCLYELLSPLLTKLGTLYLREKRQKIDESETAHLTSMASLSADPLTAWLDLGAVFSSDLP